jgi:hypothetical protein
MNARACLDWLVEIDVTAVIAPEPQRGRLTGRDLTAL